MLLLLSLTACLVNEDLYNQRRAEVIDDDHDGFTEAQGDCDDQDRQRFPGADEFCDGEDDNCNGVVDEDPVDRTWYVDADQDGHASPDSGLLACAPPGANWLLTADDCDDGDAAIFPGRAERCDGVDEDCDGEVDESPVDPETWYADADGDSFGDARTAVTACEAPSAGYVALSGDCDDTEAASYPGASEVCDEQDNDCDGRVDDAPLTGTSAFYPDEDGDGYGDPESEAARCVPGDGFVADGGDCDDGDPDVNPEAAEVCLDGVDNNCDGTASGCSWPSTVDLEDYSSIYGEDYIGLTGVRAASADTNRDGRTDLILSTNGATNTKPAQGAVDIFSGTILTDQPRSAATTTYWGTNEEEIFGTGLDTCDLDGDGWIDIVSGSSGYRSGTTRVGAILTLMGPHTSGKAWGLARSIVVGESDGSLGNFIHCGGNAAGGTTPTIIEGNWAATSDAGVSLVGMVHVFGTLDPGTSAVSEVASATVQGEEAGDSLGISVDSIDVDGDGIDDVLAGADGAGRGGLAVIFNGPVSGNLSYLDADHTMEAEASYALAGTYVVNIGDTNGDGRDDMAISSTQAAHGAVYILWTDTSLPTMLADAEITIRNSDSLHIFGEGLFSIGDINQDGEGDLFIGEGGVEPCNAHLFFGPFNAAGVWAQTDHDVSLRGDGTTDCYYSSAVNLGDQNGDGAPELMVGSMMHDVGSDAMAGIAYILPGYGW